MDRPDTENRKSHESGSPTAAYRCQSCGRELVDSPMGTAGICTACGGTSKLSAEVSFAVSYRQRGWSRRLYSMSGYDASEAAEHAAWLAANGWNRVRIEIER